MGLILQSRQGGKVSIKKEGGAKKRRKPSKVLKEFTLTVAKNGAVSLSARVSKPAKKAAKKRAKKSTAPRRRKFSRPKQLSLF